MLLLALPLLCLQVHPPQRAPVRSLAMRMLQWRFLRMSEAFLQFQ